MTAAQLAPHRCWLARFASIVAAAPSLVPPRLPRLLRGHAGKLPRARRRPSRQQAIGQTHGQGGWCAPGASKALDAPCCDPSKLRRGNGPKRKRWPGRRPLPGLALLRALGPTRGAGRKTARPLGFNQRVGARFSFDAFMHFFSLFCMLFVPRAVGAPASPTAATQRQPPGSPRCWSPAASRARWAGALCQRSACCASSLVIGEQAAGSSAGALHAIGAASQLGGDVRPRTPPSPPLPSPSPARYPPRAPADRGAGRRLGGRVRRSGDAAGGRAG